MQFENYLMLNGDITVVMRMGWQPLCSANEIVLSAQLGTLKHSYWNLHVQIGLHILIYSLFAVGGDLASSFCWNINLEAPLNKVWQNS